MKTLQDIILTWPIRSVRRAIITAQQVVLQQIYDSGIELPDEFDVYEQILAGALVEKNIIYGEEVSILGIQRGITFNFGLSVDSMLLSLGNEESEETRRYKIVRAAERLAMCCNMLQGYKDNEPSGFSMVRNLITDALK